METIKSMKIDKEKHYRLYKVECQKKQKKKTYSDRNAILINTNLISPKDVSQKNKVITRKEHEKY